MFAIVMYLVLLICRTSLFCVLMVEGMSVLVKVMLSLASVMSPSPVVKLCTLVFLH